MRYRVAVRYADGRERYHIEDVDAASMTEALLAITERVPESVLRVANLVEVREQMDEPERIYSPG